MQGDYISWFFSFALLITECLGALRTLRRPVGSSPWLPCLGSYRFHDNYNYSWYYSPTPPRVLINTPSNSPQPWGQGQPLNDLPGFTIEAGRSLAVVISDVQLDDQGYYYCQVDGLSEEAIHLTVFQEESVHQTTAETHTSSWTTTDRFSTTEVACLAAIVVILLILLLACSLLLRKNLTNRKRQLEFVKHSGRLHSVENAHQLPENIYIDSMEVSRSRGAIRTLGEAAGGDDPNQEMEGEEEGYGGRTGIPREGSMDELDVNIAAAQHNPSEVTHHVINAQIEPELTQNSRVHPPEHPPEHRPEHPPQHPPVEASQLVVTPSLSSPRPSTTSEPDVCDVTSLCDTQPDCHDRKSALVLLKPKLSRARMSKSLSYARPDCYDRHGAGYTSIEDMDNSSQAGLKDHTGKLQPQLTGYSSLDRKVSMIIENSSLGVPVQAKRQRYQNYENTPRPIAPLDPRIIYAVPSKKKLQLQSTGKPKRELPRAATISHDKQNLTDEQKTTNRERDQSSDRKTQIKLDSFLERRSVSVDEIKLYRQSCFDEKHNSQNS